MRLRFLPDKPARGAVLQSTFSNCKSCAHVGQADMGRSASNCPPLACPAGADDLKLTPSPANNASPVGSSNRNGKFVNIIAIAFSVNGLEKFIRILGKPYLHRLDTKSLKLSILVSSLVKG